MIFCAASRDRSFMDNDYHFVDRWRVEGELREVADIIEDALSFPRWWRGVYFAARELESGTDEHGTGKEIAVRAGGWLPYTLKIKLRTVESRYPHGLTIDAPRCLAG